VTDLRTLEAFLRGRLRTAGLVAAAIAAAACAHAGGPGRADAAGRANDAGDATRGGNVTRADDAARAVRGASLADAARAGGTAGSGDAASLDGGRGCADVNRGPEDLAGPVRDDYWGLLDAETDARTPAPAQREASRRQGRALLRAARVAWPDATGLAELAAAGGRRGTRAVSPASAGSVVASTSAEYRGGPHHAVVLGAAAAAAGCAPLEAARVAAYQAVAGPASAAVRLLALDPMRVTGLLARLAGDIGQVAADAAGYTSGPLGDLPAASGPALDLLAEAHIRAEVRLFES
jgi:urease accessory protein